MKWKSFPPCYYFVLGMELRPWIGQASGPVYSGASSPVLMFVFRVTTLMVFLGLGVVCICCFPYPHPAKLIEIGVLDGFL